MCSTFASYGSPRRRMQSFRVPLVMTCCGNGSSGTCPRRAVGELFTPAVVVTGVVMLPLLSLAVDRTVGSMARFKTFEKRVSTVVL